MNHLAALWMGFFPLAAAATKGPQGDQPSNPLYQSLMFILVMFFIFYFLMIRPQRKRQRDRVDMMESLKKGDRVVSSGGIHGIITLVRDREVKVKVDDNCELTFSKSGIARVVPPEGGDAKEEQR